MTRGGASAAPPGGEHSDRRERGGGEREAREPSPLSADRVAANRAAAAARYHANNPKARHYRCRRCGALGHTSKTCVNPPSSQPAHVSHEGLVVRIECTTCGARYAGTLTPEQLEEVLAAHRHPKPRRTRTPSRQLALGALR